MKALVMKPINQALFFATALSLSVIVPIQSVQASNATPTIEVQASQSYLGVAIDVLPTSLQKQLENVLVENQGVLVKEVVADSPAQKAKLQIFDILLSYNEQAIQSPKHLTQLVRTTKKGDKINLKVIRNAQEMTIPVTIGTQNLAANSKHSRYSMHNKPMHHKPMLHNPLHHNPMRHNPMHHESRHPPMMYNSKQMHGFCQSKPTKNWDSFQALSLNKLQDNQYQASIEFLDEDGQKKRFQFQGSRASIVGQLNNQELLPKTEKQQLMNLF